MPVNYCINIIFNSRIHYCRNTVNAKLRLVYIAGTIQVHSHRSSKHLRTPISRKISYGRSIIETRPKLMPPITDTFQNNRIALFIHQLRTSHTQTGQLLFLSRISGVIISLFPIDMVGILFSKTTPCPKVTSGKKSTVLPVLTNQIKYILIIFITNFCRSTFRKTKTVTRETKFFKYHRLLIFLRNHHVIINIFLRILLSSRKKFFQTISFYPSPIIRPNMDIQIVNIRICMHSFI